MLYPFYEVTPVFLALDIWPSTLWNQSNCPQFWLIFCLHLESISVHETRKTWCHRLKFSILLVSERLNEFRFYHSFWFSYVSAVPVTASSTSFKHPSNTSPPSQSLFSAHYSYCFYYCQHKFNFDALLPVVCACSFCTHANCLWWTHLCGQSCGFFSA